MKKRIPSFLAGALAMALALTLPTTALAASGEGSTVRRWQRTLDESHIIYTATADENTGGSEVSDWQLTAVPEGWKLVEIYALEDKNEYCTWTYRKGQDILTFTCDAAFGGSVYLPPKADTTIYRKAAVNGAPADFYQYGDRGILVWEDMSGVLCQLEGPLNQTELEAIAATAVETKTSALPAYQLGWVPEGSGNLSHCTLGGAACEVWTDAKGVMFRWMYAAASTGALAEPEEAPESVTVNGVLARYWEGDPDAEGGITISAGAGDFPERVLESPAESQLSTLMWTDAAAGITFRVQGKLDKDTMLRMAENIITEN